MPAQNGVETGEMCPHCGKPLVKQLQQEDAAAISSAAPASRTSCKYIKPDEGEEARPQPVETDINCPTCGKTMLERMGKTGQFLGCSGYPDARRP